MRMHFHEWAYLNVMQGGDSHVREFPVATINVGRREVSPCFGIFQKMAELADGR